VIGLLLALHHDER